jgi:hypothetical protein
MPIRGYRPTGAIADRLQRSSWLTFLTHTMRAFIAGCRSTQRYGQWNISGNAAPADGDIASPHLTGATIDIAKKGLSANEVEWMRAYLSPLENSGKLDVEEEFYQSCFHISVYQSYVGNAQTASAGKRSALLATRLP